jgi:hypothetical protein
MKSLRIMALSVGLIGVACLAPALGFAGVVSGAGTWTGTGAAFGRDGKLGGAFQVELVSTALDEHSVANQLKIILPDGQVKTITQTIRDRENGFAIESSQGNGGGYCFGDGLCECYVGDDEHGFATTIVMDGPEARRFLTTELEKGKPVRFFRENLKRMQ